MTRRLDWTYHAGDTRGLDMTIHNASGAADLTGVDNIRFALAEDKKSGATRIAKELNSGITITDAAAGQIHIDFEKDDTVNLDGWYRYGVKLAPTSTTENAVLWGIGRIRRTVLK